MTKALAALALAVALSTCSTGSAADPKLPDAKAFDKAVVDSLRDIHNKGAELYNTGKDFPAAYRFYQGALESVKPLLAHRPEVQKLIDDGLVAAEKETDTGRKAFVLHEAIENVRKNLKQVNGFVKAAEKEASIVSGKVVLDGKPLAEGEVTVVSLALSPPRVFTAKVKDGEYKFATPLPPGKYAVIVTGKNVPQKYQLVTTSGLVTEFAPDANEFDIVLQ